MSGKWNGFWGGITDIPFYLGPVKAAAILGVSIHDLNILIRSGKIEAFRDPHGMKIETASLINFLGRSEFKKKWPGDTSAGMEGTSRMRHKAGKDKRQGEGSGKG